MTYLLTRCCFGYVAYDLSIDTLDMHANNTFHRFDRYLIKFMSKYSCCNLYLRI